MLNIGGWDYTILYTHTSCRWGTFKRVRHFFGSELAACQPNHSQPPAVHKSVHKRAISDPLLSQSEYLLNMFWGCCLVINSPWRQKVCTRLLQRSDPRGGASKSPAKGRSCASKLMQALQTCRIFSGAPLMMTLQGNSWGLRFLRFLFSDLAWEILKSTPEANPERSFNDKTKIAATYSQREKRSYRYSLLLLFVLDVTCNAGHAELFHTTHVYQSWCFHTCADLLAPWEYEAYHSMSF